MQKQWFLTIAGICLITVVPLLVVAYMRRRRAKIIYPVWFTAGSSAAGYSLMLQAAQTDGPGRSSPETSAFFMLVWWLYLAIVSEGIYNSWQRLRQK